MGIFKETHVDVSKSIYIYNRLTLIYKRCLLFTNEHKCRSTTMSDLLSSSHSHLCVTLLLCICFICIKALSLIYMNKDLKKLRIKKILFYIFDFYILFAWRITSLDYDISYICVCIHTRARARARTHTHTHTHTHTEVFLFIYYYLLWIYTII